MITITMGKSLGTTTNTVTPDDVIMCRVISCVSPIVIGSYSEGRVIEVSNKWIVFSRFIFFDVLNVIRSLHSCGSVRIIYLVPEGYSKCPYFFNYTVILLQREQVS
jgi:hypothetical protein